MFDSASDVFVQPLPGAGASIHFRAMHLQGSCALLYELQVQEAGTGNFSTVRSCNFNGLARIDDDKCNEMPDDQAPLTTYHAANSLWRLRLSNPGGACVGGEVMSLDTVYCYVDAPSPPSSPPSSPHPSPPPPHSPPATAYNYFYMNGQDRAGTTNAQEDGNGKGESARSDSDEDLLIAMIVICIGLPIILFLCVWTRSHMIIYDKPQGPVPPVSNRAQNRRVRVVAPLATQRYQSIATAQTSIAYSVVVNGQESASSRLRFRV